MPGLLPLPAPADQSLDTSTTLLLLSDPDIPPPPGLQPYLNVNSGYVKCPHQGPALSWCSMNAHGVNSLIANRRPCLQVLCLALHWMQRLGSIGVHTAAGCSRRLEPELKQLSSEKADVGGRDLKGHTPFVHIQKRTPRPRKGKAPRGHRSRSGSRDSSPSQLYYL